MKLIPAYDADWNVRPEYIERHQIIAMSKLENLVERTRIRVITESLELDSSIHPGMKLITADIETLSGRRLRLRWNDGTNSWMFTEGHEDWDYLTDNILVG